MNSSNISSSINRLNDYIQHSDTKTSFGYSTRSYSLKDPVFEGQGKFNTVPISISIIDF